MPARNTSANQNKLFRALLTKLGGLGYRDELLAERYSFSDYFRSDIVERVAPAAAFGQTPPSYQTACFAVVFPDKHRGGLGLIEDYRALGAPMAFEVSDNSIVCWRVGRNRDSTKRLQEFSLHEIDAAFAHHAANWTPDAILRAKNIASRPRARQQELFDYDYELVPELEHRIKDKLDPMVQDACAAATQAYTRTASKQPDPRQLFKLAFWLLAGRVFRDRRINDTFVRLTNITPVDEVLSLVADHYNQKVPQLLNRYARQAVHEKIWSGFDFRNLSIEVLTHIWANTFVSKDVRQKLGIHPTPRSVAKYIVDLLPFEEIESENRIVIEPCAGSATFLIAALQRLRDQPGQPHDPKARHKYFQEHLIGYEQESFGIEIANLCLTLADFPNSNGWQLRERNVFGSEQFISDLQRSRIVLCNPPFEDFPKKERRPETSVKKPAALLDLILDHLHPDGILGFVLPRQIVDGTGYRHIRARLARRYLNFDITTLPDNAFETSDIETALVIAHTPRESSSSDSVGIWYSKVTEDDWSAFATFHQPTTTENEIKSIEDATERFTVQQLGGVWSSMAHLQKLGDIADIHRGLEWTLPLTRRGRETGNRKLLVHSKQQSKDDKLGLPPQAKPFYSFQSPPQSYLRMREEDERGHSYRKPWEKPKVILNKATKSRGHWRIAAFADFDKLVFYQTFTGVWPHDPTLTNAIAAVLNSPVANAFVSTIEGKVDITSETLADIPIPRFQKSDVTQLEILIDAYRRVLSEIDPLARIKDFEAADSILRQIDAIVLSAYDLPPKHERELLDFFNDERSKRVVPFPFDHYFPANFEPYFSLKEWLTGKPAQATAARFRSQSTNVPEHIRAALAYVDEGPED